MTHKKLSALSVEDLVALFTANRLKQDQAELAMETRKFRPLYDEMIAIEEELRSRPGDQRHALVALLDHPNKEVRLNAAKVGGGDRDDRRAQGARGGCRVPPLSAGCGSPDVHRIARRWNLGANLSDLLRLVLRAA